MKIQRDEFIQAMKSDFHKYNEVRTHFTAAISGLSIRHLKDRNIQECIYNHRFEDLVSLRNLLEVKDKPNEESRLLMIELLLKAVNAVHDEDIVHANINIDNIFWNSSKSRLVLGLPRFKKIE